jgi:outer membrane immunogenic protein
MRKLLLSGVAIAALAAGPATAADMGAPAYKAPLPLPPAPPVYNWTGFYVGGGFGYGLSDTETSVFSSAFNTATTSVDNGGKGWLGMATVGYDYQFNDHIVVGVFADYDLSDIKGNPSVSFATAQVNTLGGINEKENSSWYVGGRAGWLLTPNLLTYWTGGYAESHFDGVNITGLGTGVAPAGLALPANTYHGWFLGGGMETQLTFLPGPGWFVRSEYTYASYSSATLAITNSGPTGVGASTITLRPVVQTIVTGVTYKFNWTR